jgi:hypothetical protein
MTMNQERRDLNERVTKNPGSFQQHVPEGYQLTAAVDVNQESETARIIYEIMLDEVNLPMANVIQSFTLHPDMIHVFHAAELPHSNVINTYETTLEPGKVPKGLSLAKGYVLKAREELESQYLRNYTDMYVKISYGPNDQRTEQYVHLQAKPSARMIEYMKSLDKKEKQEK